MSTATLKPRQSSQPARAGAAPARPAAAAPARTTSDAGVPAYLAPVQAKCGACSADSPRPDDDAAAVQRDAAATGAAATAPAAAQQVAGAGVAQAGSPLPHAQRIQAAFGRHDISGVRAQVGGSAARASQQLGARAYTMGRRIGFKAEPDVRLAAHEAAHAVQQRQGVALKDGIGRAGDAYERQADAVAERVAANQSAESLLDSHPPGDNSGQPAVQAKCGCGGSCPQCAGAARQDESGALQMDLEVNALRLFEPPLKPAGGAADAGGGAGAAAAPATAPEAGAAASATEGAEADTGSGEGGPAAGPGSTAPAGASGASDATAADVGGSGPATADAPAGSAQPEAAPAPAAAAATAPASAAGAGGTTTSATGACAGGSTIPQCFRRPREEPNPEPESAPPNPERTQVDEVTSAVDEEDLSAPDSCAQATGGAVDLSAPTAFAAPGPQAVAGPAGAPARPRADRARAPGPAGGGADAAPAMPEASPVEGVIASAEGQRGEAVAAYGASRGTLADAGGGIAALRAGTGFAMQAEESVEATTQRRSATERANSFFSGVADRLDASLATASQQIPDQLGASAESAKAQTASAMDGEKGAISARIGQARDQARTDAAIARAAVGRQAASFIGEAGSQTAAAIATLRTAHREATGQVDTLETTTLDRVNAVYAAGRSDLAGLGTTIGDECSAKGREFATTYRSFSTCTENGFWDGNLSQRRAAAQADAAESVAKGYHDRLVEAARKRAIEATRDGRKADRCSVIATARQTRSTLDQQLASLIQALETARDAAIAQAGRTRDGLLGTIRQSLGATLRQLDQQEHDQLQLIDDTGYMQQVLQEQLAHAGAAALQQAVATAVRSTQGSMAQIQAQCAASSAPDPDLLDQALMQVAQRVGSAIDGLGGSATAGVANTEGRLRDALQQGLGSLAAVTQGNDSQAQETGAGFTASMRRIGGNDNFASQRTGFSQQMTQSTQAGSAALGQAVAGMTRGCEATLAAAATALGRAHTDLQTNLRQQRAGLECEMTSKADEAASHEAPAWKRVLAVVLVIIVIIIVVAVIIATGGGALAGLGPLAAIAAGAAIGAAVGAVTSGLLAVAGNLWSNRDWTEGVGTAILVGAVTGALGGGLGAAAGAGVGAVFSGARAGVQVATQLGAALVTAGGMDVATQYVMGGFSLDHFSWTQLGVTAVLTVVTFGIGHRVGVRAAAARAAAAPPPVTPPEPTIGFGSTPAPRAAGTPPTPEPTIGFGRTPAPRPAGTPPTPEPTIGFGRTPAPRPAGTPPTPEPTIGFGRTPAPRPAGTPPTPEPTIGFGRTPGPRPAAPLAGPAGGGTTPTAMAPEPVVVGGPRPAPRAGGASTIGEGNAPRAMARPVEPPGGGVPEPVMSPRQPSRATTATTEELPAPAARPAEEIRPAGAPVEEAPPRPASAPEEPARPVASPEEPTRPAGPAEEATQPAAPREEASPTPQATPEETGYSGPWPPLEPTGAKPAINEPGGFEWRYQRYLRGQFAAGKGPAEVMSPSAYRSGPFRAASTGGRPGRGGGPAQQATRRGLETSEGITNTETTQLGSRTVRGKVVVNMVDGVQPVPGRPGRNNYVEVDDILVNGLPRSGMRAKLKAELPHLQEGESLIFVDKLNPSRRITYRYGEDPSVIDTRTASTSAPTSSSSPPPTTPATPSE